VRYINLAISSAFERSLIYRIVLYRIVLITGPPTLSVEGQYCFARWRLSSVTLHGAT